MITKTYSQLEEYIKSIDASKYATDRNYLGGSTRLSEYITRGVISLPRTRELILKNNSLKDSEKLLQELAWREYWQRVWQQKGDGIFEYIRPLSDARRDGLPSAVLEASTGVAALDDGIRELYDTGYIHNHMRLWLAGLICNVAQCDWRVGADWMMQYLVDGDYASNHLSWQWVAGSYTGTPYLPQQENINTFTRTSQHGTYLDASYESIADMTIPEALLLLVERLDIPKPKPKLPSSTITLQEAAQAPEVLLYSPWTLDPSWHSEAEALKLLVLPREQFESGIFGQHVVDSVMSAAAMIRNLHILITDIPEVHQFVGNSRRKTYPGIRDWPGTIESLDLLYPNLPDKPYNSFSAFWKQARKY